VVRWKVSAYIFNRRSRLHGPVVGFDVDGNEHSHHLKVAGTTRLIKGASEL
jgi:hypothetical protein